MTYKQFLLRVLEHWPIKIICLVLAIFLSEFYRGTLSDKRYIMIPLRIENHTTLVPAEQYPRKIKVCIWGGIDSISSIDDDDVSAFIDMSNFKTAGVYRIPIQVRLNGAAAVFETIELTAEPAFISLKLEQSFTKRVPISLSLKGIPADGYEVKEAVAEPATVEINGPIALVEKIDSLHTETLLIEARTTGFSGMVSIINEYPLITLSGKAQIQYSVKIEETIIEKQLDNIPIYLEKLPDDMTAIVEQKTASMKIQGPQKMLESLQIPENILTISCASITAAGEYQMPIAPILPPVSSKMKVIQIIPKTIKVTVKKIEEKKEKIEKPWYWD